MDTAGVIDNALVEAEESQEQGDNEVVNDIPFSFAHRHGVLPPDEEGVVYFREGVSLEILLELRRHFARPLFFQPLAQNWFEKKLQDRFEHHSGEAGQIAADLGGEMDLSRIAKELPQSEELLESEGDAPIIRLLNALFSQAIREKASDIHVEPYEDRVSVRMRVDGILREALRTERVFAPLIASRIKVMAKLDIAERRQPQDGRITVKIAGRAVDVRVSTMPSNHGERVVMRLLDKQAARLDLEHLGMPSDMSTAFADTILRPHGIILVTGPTGSGKTTTLYAALTRLNEIARNIMTVEDPIEYDLDGISQSQVNLRAEMTFARGLRAILRQDPDVVMVGEIRDHETAQIAVQASLTGHLVFSTLHTNTAIGAVTRLRDIGVESYLLSSSLLALLAQRLVRVICPSCKEPYKPGPTELKLLGEEIDSDVHLYYGRGCDECSGKGFRGRVGIYELILVDQHLQELIQTSAGEQQLLQEARKRYPSILVDGKRKALSGITTLDEVMRVTREE